MEPVRVGFVGTGPRSESIFSSLIHDESMEEKILPVAAIDRDEGAVANWRYRVDGVYTDLEKFLDHPGLDAVLVVTAAPTHAPISTRCLEAGLDVWSEVPMGMTVDELNGIVDAEKSNKGKRGRFAYGENYCWYPSVQFVAMKHEQGKIGEVFFAEGEYCHSVEHYMVAENFYERKEVDPELTEGVHPTWRATFPPLKYGHTFGPVFYVLNRNPGGVVERPVSVAAFGNMKMQRRFNTQNFQQCIVKTDRETVCKFSSGFVLPHHGRTMVSFWATRGMFESEFSWRPTNFYYEVPPEKAQYPLRHQCEPVYLSNEDLVASGIKTAPGGHGGSDTLMMDEWVDSLLCGAPYPIPAVRGAEMTAIGICAEESIESGRMVEVPGFD
ncbi:MAG: Gfo/Idh/MocA family protein [Promethearchaeota archaeon]